MRTIYIAIAMILLTGAFTVITASDNKCDFSGDGRVAINDIISFLILARDNPDDPRLDWNGDGVYTIDDAVLLLEDIIKEMQGGGTEETKSLSDVLFGYLEQIIERTNLTPEEEAALKERFAPANSQAQSSEEQETESLTGAQTEGCGRQGIERFREQELQGRDEPGLESRHGHEAGSYEETEIRFHDTGETPGLPRSLSLSQNSPNPFNPATTISFSVPEGRAYGVKLVIHDLRGRVVRCLVDQYRETGTYSVFWDGMDESGRPTPSGVYFYRLKADNFVETRKMVLLK